MKYLLLICSLFLVACAIAPQSAEDLIDRAKKATAAKVEAERTADSAIKTSADARRAESSAREEARAALALAAEKTGEADRLGKEAVVLRNAEIAEKITLYSWILIGVGLITGAVGAFLGVRFQSKTGLVVALCGGLAVGVGVVGLFLAPHWLLVGWVFVAALVLGIIGLLVWLLVQHQAAARVAASNWKTYANNVPSEIKAQLDRTSLADQPAQLKGLIDSWLGHAAS